MRIKSPHSGFAILFLFLFCLALLAPSYVAAQVDDKEKAQKELERRQALERKTLGLVDEIVAAAWGLKLPYNRSFVLASAAELLWPRDEKRARNLYWEAFNNLGQPEGPALDDSTTRDAATKDPATKEGTSKRTASDQAQTLKRYYAMFGLRRDFFRRVAQRDPQLALEMLRATRLPTLAWLMAQTKRTLSPQRLVKASCSTPMVRGSTAGAAEPSRPCISRSMA